MGGIRYILLAAFVFALMPTPAHPQWEIEDAHTAASLRGIHNLGGGIAWASGTGGTVLRTRDDGKTWQTCPIPLAGTKDTAEKLDFRGIQAFDENTAIVMSSGPGDLSRLYKTADGCQTWKLLFTNPDPQGFWDGISSIASETVVIGDSVDHHLPVFASQNNGLDKWDRLAKGGTASAFSHLPSDETESLFAASNSILEVSSHNYIAFVSHTASHAYFCRSRLVIFPLWEDYVAPFVRVMLPLAQGESAGGFSFARNREKLGPVRYVVIGGDFSKPASSGGTAAYSLDGGRSWSAAEIMPHGYRSAVAYNADTKTWITVGPNGTDISTDDGRNWRPLTPSAQEDKDADKNWNALSLPFVVGPKGRIGKLRPNALAPTALPIANPTKGGSGRPE